MVNEQTLAQKIYQIMKEQFTHGRLRKVVIRCDSMNQMDVSRLNSYWHQIATDLNFQSSHIEVHHDPPFGKCLVCNEEFELSDETARCPRCRHEQFRIIHESPTIETYETE